MENTARTPAKFSDRPFWNKTGLDWVSMTFLLVTPFIAIAGVTVWIVNGWATGWHWLHFVLGFVVSGITVTAGYHRLFSHRSYETGWPLKLFYLLFGAANFQNSALRWASKHRYHHRFVDTDSDPYDINKGFFWAHMGWIMTGKAMHHDTQILKRYTPDLSKDPFHVALTTWHWVPQVVVGLLLLAIGGVPYVLWGVFFRTTFGLHCTWAVNSATHLWGSRRFATRDDSTNNWWVAMLTWGEGWHNNHHAHPVSARHGLAWYEIDFNYAGIKALESLGLAWDVKVAKVNQTLGEEAA